MSHTGPWSERQEGGRKVKLRPDVAYWPNNRQQHFRITVTVSTKVKIILVIMIYECETIITVPLKFLITTTTCDVTRCC